MTRKVKRVIAMIMIITILIGTNVYGSLQEITIVDAAGEKGSTNATIGNELIDKRTKFTKQFQMSDGSFTVISYSQPVHYKKNGSWSSIDMTLTKSKKYYKPKSSSLNVKISQKSNKKSVITLKRSSYSLGWALNGKKVKEKKAKISNPKKETVTDAMNHSTVTYKNVLKNTDMIYDVYPEKVQEIIRINKKQKNQTLKFKINAKNLKVKVKGKRVNFVTKTGKKKYIRMGTVVTDANGLSTTNVKLSYNAKTKILSVTPNKKWWDSKKRKFPIEIRTTYITSDHERDVKIGAAYAGAPDSNFGYDKSLLLQADKCIGYIKMNDIPELKGESVQIRDAQLILQNEKKLELASGKTFDVSTYKVLEGWSEDKLTFNNRPAYDTIRASTVALKNVGSYSFDITQIVKAWYCGESNYGIALVAENGNKTYQARIERNPYIMINYETVGIDGAAYLTENNPITKEAIQTGQEDYYYIEGEKGITYDIYTDSNADTQAILYNADKEQIGYDDDSGLGKNFLLTGNFDQRTYIKVRTKDAGTGNYTIYLKQRFARPEPVGADGRDKYIISWNAVEHAKDYQVCVYDSSGKIAETIVTGTSYDYVYNTETRDKTLGFVVTARENEGLVGVASRMIFNRQRQSKWAYTTPMNQNKKNVMAVSLNGKLYVLGGEDEHGGSCRSFSVYDTAKKIWTELPDYPGTDIGLCKASMVSYNSEIYVIGGQTDMSSNAQLLTSVYAYNIETGQWIRKQDLKESITDAATAVSRGKVYTFMKAGLTDQIDVYDIKTDTWNTNMLPGNSTVIAAASVDGRVFVLKEDGGAMRFSEYLPEDNIFEDAGSACPYTVSGYCSTPAVIGGTIYIVNERNAQEVLAYDAYTDTWSNISSMNLTKSNSTLVSSDNDVYSVGGEVSGFGIVDVVEQYTIDAKTIIKEINVNKGESYELQVNAANLKKGESQFVTLTVDPDVLEIKNSSSYHDEEELVKGIDGVKLVKYQPKKGVMVLELMGSMEQGNTCEACQSIPVKALKNTKTKVEISMADELK